MITAICPVYNEAAYINDLLEFFVKALPLEKELILVDGNSSDNTCSIIKEFQTRHKNIFLVDNPNRYVPYALNKAILAAKGDKIVRLDAHTRYSPDYFEKVVEAFNKTGADIVGGPMRIAAGNNLQGAIGYVTSTTFGVGNSSFHFENFKGYTDSVYLGAWKKNIFETTGLFDTAFKRNQDDEFHYRAKSLGFKVFQDPEIKLYYHPRKKLNLLFKQYYQYGLYKPLVLQKIKSGTSFRHLVPSLFVIYLFCLPVFLLTGFYIGFIPLAIYFVTTLTLAAASRLTFKKMILVPIVYCTLHVSYGAGFIAGCRKLAFKSTQEKRTLVAIDRAKA